MAASGLQFGVFAPAFGSDPRHIARAARERGFQGVQFEAKSSSPDLLELSASGRREFRRIFSTQDQHFVGLRSDLGPAGFGPGADVDREIDRLEKVMEAASGLGAPLVCVDLGPLPEAQIIVESRPAITPLVAGLILLPESIAPLPPPAPQAPPDPTFVAQVNSALAELGHRADRFSVMLAFRSELASFGSMEQSLRDVDCPWFGVDFDPVALLQDEWDIDEFFSRLGPQIRHIRARDAVGGQSRRTKPAVVGQGNVPWEQIQSNLTEGGYNGWITLDSAELPDRASAAVAGLKYLRSLAG